MCSKAAVGFDATDQKFVVINSDNLDVAESSEGDAVDIDGRALTILQICASVEEAKASCEQKACKMLDLNGMGLASITYDDDEPQSSSSGTDAKDLENESLDEQDTIEGNGIDVDMNNTEYPPIDTTALFQDYSLIADLQQQIDGLRSSVRNAVSMLCSDLQCDIDKVVLKQQRILKYIQQEFSIERDGRIVEPVRLTNSGFEGATFDMGSSLSGKCRLDEYLLSHMEETDRERKERIREIQAYVKRETEKKSKPNFAKPAPKSSGANRKDKEREKDLMNGDADFSFGTPGTQGKRIVNGVVQSVEKLNYPFITRECEEECLAESNGQAPIYAQLLAKVLFHDTIELYFKDQETTKRNWLHDAVDYRFPTLDKPSHVSKWKNCSYFINKNMREAVLMSGNPMPRAPCGPRGPIGPKERALNIKKEIIEEPEEAENSIVDHVPVVEKKENLHPKQKTAPMEKTKLQSKPPSSYKFLTMSYEKECFEECRGEQYKYAELMALKLFADSLENKFKEQDATKKEWLRHCVESRFPIADRDKNDQRWKICGQTCNRNRTKVIGADGREEKYPYFGQDVEEECFKKSGGVAAVYAELMNAKLFPDTQHLFFKDQHIGRRNWLHSILDKRFPAPDKAQHVSKWKTCTNAINRKLFDGTVTPITKEQSAAEIAVNNVEEETPSTSTSTPAPTTTTATTTAVSTPRPPVPKFERKPPGEGNQNGSLKRKLDETISEPSPSSKRESVRNKIRKEKVAEQYTSYPFISEEEEIDIYESSNGNPQSYGRELGRVLFKDTLKMYFKDQDLDKRQWIKEILDFRFPPKNPVEQKQKWKNVMAAINKNMTATLPPRKSVGSK